MRIQITKEGNDVKVVLDGEAQNEELVVYGLLCAAERQIEEFYQARREQGERRIVPAAVMPPGISGVRP